jgi:hypothetical protein
VQQLRKEPTVPDITLVTSSSDAEIRKRHAKDIVEWRARQLAANVLRIVRGAGKPHELAPQAAAYLEASEEHFQAARCYPGPEVGDMLRDPRPYNDKLSRDEREIQDAIETIERGVLQIVASRLIGQRTQETAGDSELWKGLIAFERAREAQRVARAVRSNPRRRPKDKPF